MIKFGRWQVFHLKNDAFRAICTKCEGVIDGVISDDKDMLLDRCPCCGAKMLWSVKTPFNSLYIVRKAIS